MRASSVGSGGALSVKSRATGASAARSTLPAARARKVSTATCPTRSGSRQEGGAGPAERHGERRGQKQDERELDGHVEGEPRPMPHAQHRAVDPGAHRHHHGERPPQRDESIAIADAIQQQRPIAEQAAYGEPAGSSVAKHWARPGKNRAAC